MAKRVHTVRRQTARQIERARREGRMAPQADPSTYEEDLRELELEQLMMPSCVPGSARKRGGVWGRGPRLT